MAPPNSLVGPNPGDDNCAPVTRVAKAARRPFVVLALLWFIGLILVDVFEKDLWELIWALAILVRWGFVGAALILTLKIVVLHMRSSVSSREARLALGIFGAGLITHFGAGDYLSMNVRFLLSRHHYEDRIPQIFSSGPANRAPDVARVEDGRAAFYWKRGVVDNWVGLVYDPAGDVMLRLDSPLSVGDPFSAVRLIFGGTLYRSRHLTGHWYICWFT